MKRNGRVVRGKEHGKCSCTNMYAAPGDLPRRATPLSLRKWVRIERQAAYRYLLQLDGHSCSWRLQARLCLANDPLLASSSVHVCPAVLRLGPSLLWPTRCAPVHALDRVT